MELKYICIDVHYFTFTYLYTFFVQKVVKTDVKSTIASHSIAYRHQTKLHTVIITCKLQAAHLFFPGLAPIERNQRRFGAKQLRCHDCSSPPLRICKFRRKVQYIQQIATNEYQKHRFKKSCSDEVNPYYLKKFWMIIAYFGGVVKKT